MRERDYEREEIERRRGLKGFGGDGATFEADGSKRATDTRATDEVERRRGLYGFGEHQADAELKGRGEWGGDGISHAGTKDLLSELFEQGKVLVKEEVRLAKAELRQEVNVAKKSAGAIGVGAYAIHVGLLVLAGFFVAVLSLLLPVWAAALIVAVVYLGGGAIAASSGAKKLKKLELKPEQTIETLKEDQEWLRQMMRGGTSSTRANA